MSIKVRILEPDELEPTVLNLAQHGIAGNDGYTKAGFDGFYRGPVAKKLVDGVRAEGGQWTAGDLAAYRVHEREPVVHQNQPSSVACMVQPARCDRPWWNLHKGARLRRIVLPPCANSTRTVRSRFS